MDLGKKLFELRKSKNLSQEDVADKLNVTRQTVSKWETNQSTPDFDKIVPLCDLYGISTDELLKEEIKKEQEDDKVENKKNIYENMTKNEINQKSAEIVSSSILIFIIAIAFAGIGVAVLRWNPIVVGCTFLILIGWGVTRIVKHYMSIPELEKTKEEKKQDKIVKQINDIIGAIGKVNIHHGLLKIMIIVLTIRNHEILWIMGR